MNEKSGLGKPTSHKIRFQPVGQIEEFLHADVISDKLRNMPNDYLQVEREAPFTDDTLYLKRIFHSQHFLVAPSLKTCAGSVIHQPRVLH